MKKILIFTLSIILALSLFACRNKEDPPVESSGASESEQKNTALDFNVKRDEISIEELKGKSFLYEGENHYGYFTISFYEDGQCSYYEGMLSSFLGVATWTVEDGILTITDRAKYNGKDRINHFKIGDGYISFIKDGSSGFIYVNVDDGEKFNFLEDIDDVTKDTSN